MIASMTSWDRRMTRCGTDEGTPEREEERGYAPPSTPRLGLARGRKQVARSEESQNRRKTKARLRAGPIYCALRGKTPAEMPVIRIAPMTGRIEQIPNSSVSAYKIHKSKIASICQSWYSGTQMIKGHALI